MSEPDRFDEPRSVDSESPPEPATERTVWDNFRDTIVEPTATFLHVADRPKWLIPLLVIVAVTVVVSWIMMPMFIELQRLQIIENVPPENREQALRQIETFAGPLGLAISVVATPVFMAILAFLFWAVALVSGAANARYNVAFTAMVYAGVTYVLQGIAQAIVVLIKGGETAAREGGPPTFGLGLLVERGEMAKPVYGLIANVNFFSIWYVILIALAGVYALKMGRGAAYGFAVLLWVLTGVVLGFNTP